MQADEMTTVKGEENALLLAGELQDSFVRYSLVGASCFLYCQDIMPQLA